jgi:hypothetical protein
VVDAVMGYLGTPAAAGRPAPRKTAAKKAARR